MTPMGTSRAQKGLAVLVGAGPGEAGLVTAAGAKWLSQANVVFYDRLASPELLALAPPGAERIYVGKRPGAPGLSQEEIGALLVEKCRPGQVVVRLKGGDPLVFGRGGEEADALAAAGIPFRIVPGVTAAIAAGSYAGIPLTDRRCASTVAFVTGHEDPAKGEPSVDYDALAGVDTLVFYMGVGNLAAIAERLRAAGRSEQTPVAIVQNATRPDQRTVEATLATAANAAAEANVEPPALIIVGEVVRLRERIAWLEKLPLWGQRVLVTRTRRQASRLAEGLALLGANVIECPTIEIRPPEDWAVVDAALRRLGEFDWLVLTSPNGSAGLVERLRTLGMDARALAGVRIAAVGPATARVLREHFLEPDLVPAEYTTQALGEALAPEAGGKRLLLARADIATDTLPDLLRAAGGAVEHVAVYRTVRPASLPDEALASLREAKADWITFTSSSTVENFLALIASSGVSLEDVKLASIGPVTTETLKAHGLRTIIAAEVHTIDGLIDAIVRGGQQKG